MKRLILKLALATVALGLCAATPAPAQTPQQQMLLVRARQMGMWSRVSIFSRPQFSLVTDPRGANFGFSQSLIFGPSFRSVFSPWSQTTMFRSNASTQLLWTPSTGPIARINTPAIFGFNVNANGTVTPFSRPSISVLSNLNGSVAAINSAIPQFLSGNFNFTVPMNGTFAIPASSTSMTSANLTSSAALNNAFSTAVNSSSMANVATNMGLTRAQAAATTAAATTMNSAGPNRFMTIAQGLSMGLTLDQILHSPMSVLFGVRAAPRGGATNAMWWGPKGTIVPAANFNEDTLPLAKQAAQYNGYVPPSMIQR